PSVFGQSVIFAATVSAVAPGTGTLTGTVTFSVDGTPLATNNLISGLARYTNATLAVGPHTITAAYSGDGSFNPNTSSDLTQTVNQASTSTTLLSSNLPAVFGQPVIFASTVSVVAPGAGTPTGAVTFSVDGTPQATNGLSGNLARYTNAALSVG